MKRKPGNQPAFSIQNACSDLQEELLVALCGGTTVAFSYDAVSFVSGTKG
jgi:hypothetical protein